MSRFFWFSVEFGLMRASPGGPDAGTGVAGPGGAECGRGLGRCCDWAGAGAWAGAGW